MMQITATFPDGKQIKRNSAKKYTHAWRVCWLRPLNKDGKPVDTLGNVMSSRVGSEDGFASSPELAFKAANGVKNRIESFQHYEITALDVVPVNAKP